MNKRICVLAVAGVSLLAAAVIVRGEESAANNRVGHVQLPLGKPAPEIQATDLDGKAVTLASFHGKPVVLEFGSLTEPWFRERVPAVARLAAKYGDTVAFVIIYQHEAHAADSPEAIEENTTDGFNLAKPTSQSERVKAAQQAKDRLHIENETLLVDGWSNTTSDRYGNYPNMAFVIDATGNLQAGYPWMDPKKVQGAVDALLAGKEVPAELRGPVHPQTGEAHDYGEVAMDMTGNAQGAKLVKALDSIQMTDEQKKAVLPPLLQFMADARNFRELRSGNPKANVGAAGGSAGKGAGKAAATQPDSDGVKTVTADDLQTTLQKLRDSAIKLKQAVNENLSAKDAQTLLDAIEQGPGKRLFADN